MARDSVFHRADERARRRRGSPRYRTQCGPSCAGGPEWVHRPGRGSSLVWCSKGSPHSPPRLDSGQVEKPCEVRGITDRARRKTGDRLGEAVAVTGFEVPAEGRALLRPPGNDGKAHAWSPEFKRGAGGCGAVGRRASWATRLRTISLPSARPWRIWDLEALRFAPTRLWAFFRFRLPGARGFDLITLRRDGELPESSALHVAAWHYWESEPQSDEYLRTLIEVCHRQAISVYAWIALPHVSEKFWEDHPEWRETTALLEDAQLDWRKLINLTNRSAFAAVSSRYCGISIGPIRLGRDQSGRTLFRVPRGPYENPARLIPAYE